MRILVISDTHRKEERIQSILKQEQAFDLAIHLGDAEGKHREIRKMLDCNLVAVRGNCDQFSELPIEKGLVLQEQRILLTHGHHYNVHYNYMLLAKTAAMQNCRIAMFGHTHRPLIKEEMGVLLLNPGSIGEPRQADRKPSYLVLNISEDGSAEATIKFLEGF